MEFNQLPVWLKIYPGDKTPSRISFERFKACTEKDCNILKDPRKCSKQNSLLQKSSLHFKVDDYRRSVFLQPNTAINVLDEADVERNGRLVTPEDFHPALMFK